MAGNVWEWVQDEVHTGYNGAPSDGSGWCEGDCPINASDANYNESNTMRMVRGGSWRRDASLQRAAGRSSLPPSSQQFEYGGRLARSVR